MSQVLSASDRAIALEKLKALGLVRRAELIPAAASHYGDDNQSTSSRSATPHYTTASTLNKASTTVPTALATPRVTAPTSKQGAAQINDAQQGTPKAARAMGPEPASATAKTPVAGPPTATAGPSLFCVDPEQLAAARREHDSMTKGLSKKPDMQRSAPSFQGFKTAPPPTPARKTATNMPISRATVYPSTPAQIAAIKNTPTASSSSATTSAAKLLPPHLAAKSTHPVSKQTNAAVQPAAAVPVSVTASTIAKQPVEVAVKSNGVVERPANVPTTPKLKASGSELPPTPPSISSQLTKAMSDLTITDRKPWVAAASGRVIQDVTNRASAPAVRSTKPEDESTKKQTAGQVIIDRAAQADKKNITCTDDTVANKASEAHKASTNGTTNGVVQPVGDDNESGDDAARAAGDRFLAETANSMKVRALLDEIEGVVQSIPEVISTNGRPPINGSSVVTSKAKESDMMAELRSQVVDLLHRVMDLERDVETFKFVGTQNSKTPFMVEVLYPTGVTKRIQTFGQMRVNRLLERIMREQGTANSTNTNVLLKHGSVELGHLALVGEYDLQQGHQLVLTYDQT